MTMFNYLTIEQAIKYVSSKINYEFSYENLKDLEAFQIIQPVFFFQGFAKFHYMEDKEAITEIGGYFQLYEGESLISKEDINFDKCFLYQPALDDYDTFDGEIEICLNLEEQVRVEDGYEVIPSLTWIKDSHVEINPYNYSFYLYDLDDNGNEFIKSAIKPYEVRIKKAELDDWLMTTIEDDKAQSLQTRISELEKQLEQSSQQQTEHDEPTHHKTVGCMTALIATLLKMAEYDKEDLKEPYGDLNNLIKDKASGLELSIGKDFIAKWLKKANDVL